MRIALTIESFAAERGGGEAYARRFARSLAEAGHEVHVFAGEEGEPVPGVTFHPVPIPKLKPLRRLRFARRCCRELEKHSFDIVHGFGKSICMDLFRPGGGVHLAWMERDLLAIESPILRLVTRMRRLFSLDQWAVRLMERGQFRAEDGPHIIAVSRMTRDDIVRFYKVPPERITVIYNGVDLERFAPANRALYRAEMRRDLGLTDEIAILFVANNFRLKGLGALIRALPLVKRANPRIRLLVAGRGAPARYRRLAERLGCEGEVQFLGHSQRMERLYAAADVLAHPSFYDPCANVCLEALASGIPVVTSPFNGSGELITEGREGFVVDPRDTAALADRIVRCLDPKFRAEAGEAARLLAEEHSMENNLRQVLALYERLLAKRGAKS